jgi:hypothetical protein
MKQMAYLGGYQPQDLEFSQRLNLQLNQFFTPLLMNETGPHRGIVVTAGIYIASTNFNTLPGALDVGVEYAFDGATTPTPIPLFAWNGVLNQWDARAIACACDHKGDGSAQGDFLTLALGITFRYACIVRINCNSAPDIGTPRLAHFACHWARAADVV